MAFQKIEMCMESLPDTALYLLKSVPHPEKLRGKSQADYALLLTQAMDQNYVKFTSDSLIALALNYYTVERGDTAMRAKAQYYYGRVLRELGKDEEALSFLSSAKEMFGKIQCCKMFAMATDEIGMVNRKKKLYQESLKNFQESYAIYEELKRGYTGEFDGYARPKYSADLAQATVQENFRRRGNRRGANC